MQHIKASHTHAVEDLDKWILSSGRNDNES